MRITQVNLETKLAPVKKQPKTPPSLAKPKDYWDPIAYMEEEIVFVVGGETYHIQPYGVLLIHHKNHSFQGNWGVDGTVSGLLYDSLPEETKKMKKLLSMEITQEWVGKYGKRN